VASVDIEALGWRFTPAIKGGVIVGFIAELLPSISRPGHLNMLWFEARQEGIWDAWGWSPGEPASSAIAWVRSHLADDSLLSENPRLRSQARCEAADRSAPVRLRRGLLEDDPLQQLLGAEPRTQNMFDTMEQAGWAVAPELSELSEGDYNGIQAGSLQRLLRAIEGRTLNLMPDLNPQKVGVVPTDGIDFPWDCSCATSYGSRICGPWVPSTPDITLTGNGQQNCHWERTCSTLVRSVGDYSITCVGCTGTYAYDELETQRVTQALGSQCVPPPP
jgi:hypothetical protein